MRNPVRHLSTAELLLYAEGELADRELCRHVAECVDCKARLVDVQETYVLAAQAIRARPPQAVAQPAQLRRLRVRLAEEAELLSAHLTTEELLLSIEGCLEADRQEHLAACASCQDQAADIHIRLAEIECELHRQLAFEVPAERRAVALAKLRERLAEEVELQTAARAPWAWLPTFRLPAWPKAPAFTPYAAACAAALLAVWIGWNAVPAPASLDLSAVARPAPPPAPASAWNVPARPAALAAVRTAARLPPQRPALFDWTPEPAVSGAAPAPVTLRGATAPELAWTAPELSVPAFVQPESLQLAEPPAGAQLAAAQPPPAAASVPGRQDAPEAVIQGAWMLARTGLWREAIQATGTAASLRFVGSVASERARAAAERDLRAAADGWPVSFAISVPGDRAAATRPQAVPGAPGQPSGGLLRNTLLEHYRDAARRSFQPPEPSLLESELDRYVSEMFRHESELLAHASALRGVLAAPGIEGLRNAASLRNLVDFHLNAVERHQSAIDFRLSEALPRRYWAHRGAKEAQAPADSLAASGRYLAQDALDLDRNLTEMFFGSRGPVDAQASNLSAADLLKRIRQRARELRASLKRSVN